MYNMSCVCQRDGHKINARVAQLVEHNLAKVGAAGSSPVSRSNIKKSDSKRNRSFFTSSPAVARSSRSRLSPRSTILLEVFRHHFLQLLLSLLLMHRHQ